MAATTPQVQDNITTNNLNNTILPIQTSSDLRRSKQASLAQDVPYHLLLEYDVHVTVPCAPAYLLDPNIYKSYGH